MVGNNIPVPPSGRHITQVALSLVTVGYVICNVLWFTAPPEVGFGFPPPLKQFWLFWGLQQNWRLFSPKIRDINYHVAGIVTFADGYKEVWEPPRLDKESYFDRLRDDKYRKWSIDSLPWPAHKQYWPDVARYVGRKLFNKENPPVEFSLLLFWTKIPPPTQMARREKMPTHDIVNHVFTYRYRAGDFN